MTHFKKLAQINEEFGGKKIRLIGDQDNVFVTGFNFSGGILKIDDEYDDDDSYDKKIDICCDSIEMGEEVYSLIIDDALFEKLKKYGITKIIMQDQQYGGILFSCSHHNLNNFIYKSNKILETGYIGNLVTAQQFSNWCSESVNFNLYMPHKSTIADFISFFNKCSKDEFTRIICMSTNTQDQAEFIRTLIHTPVDLSFLTLISREFEYYDSHNGSIPVTILKIVEKYLHKGKNIRQRDIPGFEQEMIDAGFEEYL